MPQPRAGRGGRPESARRVARSTLRERGAQSTSGAWAGSKRSSSQEVGWLGRPYGVLPSQCDSATRAETGDLCTRWWTHTCVETTEAVRVVPTCPHRSVQSHGEVDRGVRGSRVSPAAAVARLVGWGWWVGVGGLGLVGRGWCLTVWGSWVGVGRLVSGGLCFSVWGWWVGVGRSWFVLAGMAWVGWGR